MDRKTWDLDTTEPAKVSISLEKPEDANAAADRKSDSQWRDCTYLDLYEVARIECADLGADLKRLADCHEIEAALFLSGFKWHRPEATVRTNMILAPFDPLAQGLPTIFVKRNAPKAKSHHNYDEGKLAGSPVYVEEQGDYYRNRCVQTVEYLCEVFRVL